MVGQKGLNPAIASIIMSFESCVSVIAAWLIQGNAMSVREMMGCAIMLAAIILAQIPAKKEKTK
jgi:drug/metabolite transporter (DMT)-like permease